MAGYYSLTPEDLAAWLDRQGHESWWTVDGDYYLAGSLEMPCTKREMAEFLRAKPTRDLRVRHPEKPGPDAPRRIEASMLDDFVYRAPDGSRELMLAWDAGDTCVWWVLYEDHEAAALAAATEGDEHAAR
jgi:hypothetical protein